jgi:hypothetical protein
VILVDANLLVYAHLLAFVRLVSNPRVFARPLTAAQAWAQIESWLSIPVVWIPQPTERHKHVLARLFAREVFRTNLAPDAHLAALAMEHGLTLCSVDGDFARFAGLRWENPIAG